MKRLERKEEFIWNFFQQKAFPFLNLHKSSIKGLQKWWNWIKNNELKLKIEIKQKRICIENEGKKLQGKERNKKAILTDKDFQSKNLGMHIINWLFYFKFNIF